MALLHTMTTGIALGVVITLGVAGSSLGQHSGHGSQGPEQKVSKASVRITMEELHKHGGVPPGWSFTIPDGDQKKGREVFAKLECYKCNEVKGEQFPHAPRGPDATGPELSGMGGRHPAEYLAESILNPNAVIVIGQGYTGPDGLSIMPDYRESLTASELIDLVAYLKSLAPASGHAPSAPHGSAY